MALPLVLFPSPHPHALSAVLRMMMTARALSAEQVS
jgi:hypothetical protein